MTKLPENYPQGTANIADNRMLGNVLQFNKDDLKKVIGYILYDMLELGLLNGKGTIIANSTKEIPDDIIDEIGNKGINIYLKEKQLDGKVL